MVSVHGPHVPLLPRSRFMAMAMVKVMDARITRSKDRIQWPGLGAAVWTRLLFLYDVLETLSRILESFILVMISAPFCDCIGCLICFVPVRSPPVPQAVKRLSASQFQRVLILTVSHKIQNKI